MCLGRNFRQEFLSAFYFVDTGQNRHRVVEDEEPVFPHEFSREWKQKNSEFLELYRGLLEEGMILLVFCEVSRDEKHQNDLE